MATMAARSAWVAILSALAVPAIADESAIIADITAFLKTDDQAQRRQLVNRITADPAYERTQVSAWLHLADVFPDLKPGRHEIHVPLRTGGTRTVVLRLPKSYDPHRPWPLIYALHGSGGHSDNIIGFVQKLLAADSDQYVIAAPDSYADLTIHQPEWPPAAEHPAALRKIKQTVNIDSDRVYLAGYSLGGHTSWTLAVLHADQFAGAMPLASTFTIILPDLLWESFLPNLSHLPLLCVWGEADTKYGGERISPEGGIAGVNRKLRELLAQNGLPATMIELPGKGHGEVEPPPDELAKLLACTREHFPTSIRHTFRDTYQGQAYWLEAHQWAGDQWTDKQRNLHVGGGGNKLSDADIDAEVARTFRGLLGELEGYINGQEIRIHRKKIKELTVWIGDGMLDWSAPVVIKIGGTVEFEGRLEPDLYVCLSQAARTWDFDRLRWAGVRIKSGAKTKPIAPETEFPDLLTTRPK